jgi:predicted Zn-dependent protease
MNRIEAQDLVSGILDIPHEGELRILLNQTNRLGTRFNDCAISQNVLRRQTTLTLTGRLEQKQSSVTINTPDDRELIQRSIENLFATCRHMPDDEEIMPATGKVIDTVEHAFSPAADAIEIEDIGAWTALACETGTEAKVDLAGLLAISRMSTSYGDSAGGFAHERHHRIDYHVTASGDHGSGWAEQQGLSIDADQVMAATRRAIDKCIMAQDPIPFEPGPTTVILEPQAVGDLLSMAFWYGFGQRARDEGRSVFAHHDGAFGKLSLYSDPAYSVNPTLSFTSGGEPLDKSVWLDRGELQQLVTDRYWAHKQDLPLKSSPGNLILSGEGSAVDDLVKSTPDGILVTRFWYIRATDQGTLGFTGMTRDGTYRIDNGEITHPVVEMRWNESVLRLLNNIVGSGEPVATGGFFPMAMPALKVDDFPFSSLSE